jgi:hypothetical protein
MSTLPLFVFPFSFIESQKNNGHSERSSVSIEMVNTLAPRALRTWNFSSSFSSVTYVFQEIVFVRRDCTNLGVVVKVKQERVPLE